MGDKYDWIGTPIATFSEIITKSLLHHYRIIDFRFTELSIKEVVYDVRSKYQHILILDTVDFGKLLVLDGFANLAESDTVGYTHSLMDLPKVTPECQTTSK